MIATSAYLNRPLRTRLAIIRDYAARHGLSVQQVRDLVAQLPDARPSATVHVLARRKA